MPKANRQYAYLSFTGSFEPADITTRIGIQPTKTRRAGDFNPRTKLEYRFSAWQLRSRLSEESSLEAHMQDVFEETTECRDAVEELARQYNGCMQLVAYFHAGYPGLYFESDMVAELTARGLSVDFDFYDLAAGDDTTS